MNDTPRTISPGPQRDVAEGYRPVSALAVAALIVACGAALSVIGVWITAKVGGRPLVYPMLLLAAGLGIVLGLAALWHIRRTQESRGGKKLARSALWISLLTLGAYGAYAIAIYQAIRLQARAVADQYFTYLSEKKPELAFRLTRPPERQRTIETNPQKIRDLFGSNELFGFNQSDLTRIYRTWGDRAKTQFVGVRGADAQDPTAIELNYVLRCPEGEFDVAVLLREFIDKATGAREFQVMHPATRMKAEKPEEQRRTKLGRICNEVLNEIGGRFLRDRWLANLSKDEAATIVRVNGKPVTGEQRDKLLADVLSPGKLDLYPSMSPMARKNYPTVHFDPASNTVWMDHLAVLTAPSLDPKEPRIAAHIKVQLSGKELVNEMLKLAGPAGDQQPLLPSEEYQPELSKYKFDLKVTELDLRTDEPRVPSPPQTGPRGGM